MAVKAGFGNALGIVPGITPQQANIFKLDSLSSRTRVNTGAAFLGEGGEGQRLFSHSIRKLEFG